MSSKKCILDLNAEIVKVIILNLINKMIFFINIKLGFLITPINSFF